MAASAVDVHAGLLHGRHCRRHLCLLHHALESFCLLAALIVGGSGNYWGAFLGAFALIEGLNELSRYAPSFGRPELAGAVRAMLIGVVLILVLRYRPEGLIPERWLHWYGRLGQTGSGWRWVSKRLGMRSRKT